MSTDIIILSDGSVNVVVGDEGPPGQKGPAGGAAATDVTYDDVLTQLGAANLQEAVVALWNLIQAGPTPPADAGNLDFSKSGNPLSTVI